MPILLSNCALRCAPVCDALPAARVTRTPGAFPLACSSSSSPSHTKILEFLFSHHGTVPGIGRKGAGFVEPRLLTIVRLVSLKRSQLLNRARSCLCIDSLQLQTLN